MTTAPGMGNGCSSLGIGVITNYISWRLTRFCGPSSQSTSPLPPCSCWTEKSSWDCERSKIGQINNAILQFFTARRMNAHGLIKSLAWFVVSSCIFSSHLFKVKMISKKMAQKKIRQFEQFFTPLKCMIQTGLVVSRAIRFNKSGAHHIRLNERLCKTEENSLINAGFFSKNVKREK